MHGHVFENDPNQRRGLVWHCVRNHIREVQGGVRKSMGTIPTFSCQVREHLFILYMGLMFVRLAEEEHF